MIAQGDVWWADLGEPRGSEPAFRRPVVVVQCDALNRSKVATVLCVPLTSQLEWADAPGNVLLRARDSGLDHDSVANVSQVGPIDRDYFDELAGRLRKRDLARIFEGIDLVLGR